MNLKGPELWKKPLGASFVFDFAVAFTSIGLILILFSLFRVSKLLGKC